MIYYVHSFRTKHEHHFIDRNGRFGYNPDQCVNVDNTWMGVLGLDESLGNANQLDYSVSCDWVKNDPTNHPSLGSLVIWTGYPADPLYGHTAVSLHKCDAEDLWVLSQNFPDGSPCERRRFSYEGVAGWWTPRDRDIR